MVFLSQKRQCIVLYVVGIPLSKPSTLPFVLCLLPHLNYANLLSHIYKLTSQETPTSPSIEKLIEPFVSGTVMPSLPPPTESLRQNLNQESSLGVSHIHRLGVRDRNYRPSSTNHFSRNVSYGSIGKLNPIELCSPPRGCCRIGVKDLAHEISYIGTCSGISHVDVHALLPREDTREW